MEPQGGADRRGDALDGSWLEDAMMHAVSVIVFNSDPVLVLRTIESTLTQSRPPDLLQVLVSGSGPDDPLAAGVNRACSAATSGTTCRVIVRADNLGFAGGHNYLADKAFAAGADWVTLLNPDLDMDPDALERYWASVEEHAEGFAIHGPHLVTRTDEGEVIDSAGIVWSRDARHFDADQGQPAVQLPDWVHSADGVSGALLTLSRDTHAKLLDGGGEFLDELFLAYREDAELGRRIRVMGGSCLIHPTPGFRHRRGARNAERTSPLQRLLGVQNRFLMRARLGPERPGSAASALIRDLTVVTAVVVRERSSLPGLRRAWSVRRFERYKGRAAAAAPRR
ncbi:glycosyltransferase family 2 protein [Nocardioides euryhalodurans]|uniref:Glycosyltransferase family 2 protein n=1 Tax=Nocardioides euryhalodurans TaxID=2518370 RepID=A0A4P7GMY4_9ACTN|nr:glycosyltransferase [Nocardioides euryhalodurans]QBR93393.1 glycosyltransferase family 2 protein [Nocardioides euryhalodurans]